MNTSPVIQLKKHLENLFPGQWVTNFERTKTLSTGFSFLDQGPTRGLARQKISAWVGPASCGKTSLLRSIISHWCAYGFQIIYIDVEDKLLASNWVFIENPLFEDATNISTPGKFWTVRNLVNNDYLWATESLVRSNIFDVVILDLGSGKYSDKQINWRSNKIHARLQNSLGKSKTALLLLTDNNYLPQGWNFYARLDFHWSSNMQYIEGLQDKVNILPTINCRVTKDGLSNNTEVPIISYAANRLFTHSPIPDRRTAKT